jgi:circadian clock protein KaiB
MNTKKRDGKPFNGQYVFCLYVTGASPNSLRAIANTKAFCEEYFKDDYELDVIDVYQSPGIAKEENIIALPLLVQKQPLPEKRFIGDMSKLDQLLKGFGFTSQNVK